MSRFYTNKENVQGKIITISGDEAHHILNVMRLTDGDKIIIFDGTGSEYHSFIKESNPKSKNLVCEIIQTKRPLKETLPKVTLAQAVPKKTKMDYIVEKATELGVFEIIPIISDRTIVRPDGVSSSKKVDRWNKLAITASKQCGRVSIPIVRDFTMYKDILTKLDSYDLILMAHLEEGTFPLKEAIKEFTNGNILVFIGPEGDFTEEENKGLKYENCKFVSLGNRVLKSDTAGLFMLSALVYELAI